MIKSYFSNTEANRPASVFSMWCDAMNSKNCSLHRAYTSSLYQSIHLRWPKMPPTVEYQKCRWTVGLQKWLWSCARSRPPLAYLPQASRRRYATDSDAKPRGALGKRSCYHSHAYSGRSTQWLSVTLVIVWGQYAISRRVTTKHPVNTAKTNTSVGVPCVLFYTHVQ